MAYKCVHCGKIYDDGSEQILKGCDDCSRKFFFYIKKEQLEKISQKEISTEVELSEGEKQQVERDVREISGLEDDEAPVILDFESVKVVKPGKYLLDVANLFATDKPRVYKLEDGKFIIDLSSKAKTHEK